MLMAKKFFENKKGLAERGIPEGRLCAVLLCGVGAWVVAVLVD